MRVTRILQVSLALLLMALFVAPLNAGNGPKPGNSFRLVTQFPQGWVVEYVPRMIQPSIVMVDGAPHLLYAGQASAGDEGVPQLPSEALTIGIPAGATIQAELVDQAFEDIPGQLVAPIPTYNYSEEKEATALYRKDRSVYDQSTFFPRTQVTVEPPFDLRLQRISTVRVASYLYNPGTRLLRRLTKATLRIRLSQGEGPVTPLRESGDDPYFEDIYRNVIWNYDQAREWRTRPAMRVDRGMDPTRDWFEVGRTYYRIKIATDGWYKVTTADLAAAGANTSQIDIPTLRVFSHGEEVPLLIRPDTTIEFYAMRNYGDSTFLDFYTDTNTYWVTWGGATQGLRLISSPQPGGTPGASVQSAVESRHLEQNIDYFFGLGEAEVTENGTVAGEGWFWMPMFGSGTYTIPITVDTVNTSGGVSLLRARFHGMSPNFSGVDHHLVVFVNDSLAGEILFEGRTEGLLTDSIPSQWLINGSNTVRIISVNTPSFPNQVYLDWIELDYPRYLRAIGDQLHFTVPAASGTDPTMITVVGFSNPQIDVLDLSGRRSITGGTVTGDSTSGYSIAFRDTLSSPRSYVVFCAGGQRSVPPVSQKVFSDIRVNVQGADYVVIAHRTFMTSAQQLASDRQAVNGVRTAVIDVQDIYDEFNYGTLNANPVKAFLRHAYTQWPSPAPSYVLMFGDASWDFHKYKASSQQVNYVPAYGVPSGDNWFGCFDSTVTFIPSLLIGRLPVTDPLQAQRTVSKIIGYDGYTLDEWNKNFLFITGGNSLGEQNQFNALSNTSIDSYVMPPPIGGTPFRVYKSSLAIIDGENKQLLRSIIRDGVVFLNFLGHSGGNVWGVDVGDPNTLENTNGRLPFVSSVSCNVGAFADPAKPLLAENFLLADNRGAIATWASSSLGYATVGGYLVQYFLSAVTDSIRDFGGLTTTARFRLWQNFGNYFVYVAMVKLNPLLGDPLSRFAIPLKPDLTTRVSDIKVSPSTPSPNDTSINVTIKFHNYGLVPPDSVGISLSDVYNGQTIPLLSNKKLPPTRHHDSLSISWDAAEQIGRHTLTATLDPTDAVEETNELNNNGTADQYVYANILAVVKPLDKMVVPPGPQTLTVTSPIGLDSVGFQYFFEVDTVATFDSPFLTVSGGVTPGPVKGEWTTPSLPAGQLFFWRARTMDGTILGTWITSSFSTSSSVPGGPSVLLREYSPKQFAREMLKQTAATDSGVTIAAREPLTLYSRSLGYRAVANDEYYSTIRLNDINFIGYWWVVGNAFMVVRVNEFDGSYDFRSFNTVNEPAQADSMVTYLRNTPNGNFLAISVVYDGRTNVTELLYDAIQSLGSTLVRQVLPGQSWAFIGRKGANGPGMAALESLTNDSAVVSLQIPNYYSIGAGSVTTTDIPVPFSWGSLGWQNNVLADGRTDANLALLGIRRNGQADTLRVVPSDSTSINLSFLDPHTSGPTYQSLRLAGLLSSSDALVTPSLKEWLLYMMPPADLAISARTIGNQEVSVARGSTLDLPITVYNIGYRQADSARVVVSVYDRYNRARPIASAAIDSIPVAGLRSLTIPISTTEFSRRVTLQISVSPPKRDKDLIPGNNVAYHSFTVVGGQAADMEVFADGVRLMDGDFVSSAPRIVVRLPRSEAESPRFTEFFVDDKPVNQPTPGIRETRTQSVGEEVAFVAQLAEGRHELRVRSMQASMLGGVDTADYRIVVRVMNELQILQPYNYPNPFSGDTYFTFVVTGSRPPEELTIRIFTVTGRKIREIAVQGSNLQVGFNRIYWDGRDTDGDEVANGYYFYQLTAKGQGKVETAIEKLAKVR